MTKKEKYIHLLKQVKDFANDAMKSMDEEWMETAINIIHYSTKLKEEENE